MKNLEARIVELEPMMVASVRAFGESPEPQAWEQLRAWAEPKGLLADHDKHPVFGFNNPGPCTEGEAYGYEFWIRLDQEQDPEGKVEIKQFPGGLFAVTRCMLMGTPNVGETWKLLWDWVQASDYVHRETHELEKLIDPMAPMEAIELELYFPIQSAVD